MSKINYKTIISLLSICAIYFCLRFIFPQTIEFGYDQPLLTNQVIAFLRHPTYLNAYSYVLDNPLGFPSWGTAQIFFYAPFVFLTKHPLYLSLMVATFNMLSVVIIFFIGVRFYSYRSGVISALLLATQPWWVIFSRMLYQPAPVITFECLCIYLLLSVIRNYKTKAIFLFMASLTFLLQLYIHSISFIIPSLLVLIGQIRKINFKWLILGIFFSLILYLPAIKFYISYPDKLLGIIEVERRLDQISLENKLTVNKIINQYSDYLAGGFWDWQLGYATKYFYHYVPILKAIVSLFKFFSLALLLIFMIFIMNINHKKELLYYFCCMLGPVWFILTVKNPSALPRYLLLGIPPFVLLISNIVDYWVNILLTAKQHLAAKLLISFPIGLSIWGIVITLLYYKFLSTFSFPQGMLSPNSDVPYTFIAKSLNWIFKDASEHNFKNIIISNNIEHPHEYDLNIATRYALDNMYNFSYVGEKKADASYVMMLKPLPKNVTTNSVQFGPYAVFKMSND